MAAIEVSGLEKSFGRQRALAGLDLEVALGEVHGFVGPNGAGKSTTIRILLGLLKSDGGRARLLGGDPRRDVLALHRRVAYVPGDVALWPNLTGGEVIDLLEQLRGGPAADRRAELIQRFRLDPARKCRTYSKGNRQKVALVAAFAGSSELLILDEPTSGLDPLMERVFADCVEEEKQAGRTILLSSHIMSEVEALADRVTVVRDGRTVRTGTLDELRAGAKMAVDAVLQHSPASLADRFHTVTVEGNRIRGQLDPAALPDFLQQCTELGVVSMSCEPPSLDSVFLSLYDRDPA